MRSIEEYAHHISRDVQEGKVYVWVPASRLPPSLIGIASNAVDSDGYPSVAGSWRQRYCVLDIRKGALEVYVSRECPDYAAYAPSSSSAAGGASRPLSGNFGGVVGGLSRQGSFFSAAAPPSAPQTPPASIYGVLVDSIPLDAISSVSTHRSEAPTSTSSSSGNNASQPRDRASSSSSSTGLHTIASALDISGRGPLGRDSFGSFGSSRDSSGGGSSSPGAAAAAYEFIIRYQPSDTGSDAAAVGMCRDPTRFSAERIICTQQPSSSSSSSAESASASASSSAYSTSESYGDSDDGGGVHAPRRVSSSDDFAAALATPRPAAGSRRAAYLELQQQQQSSGPFGSSGQGSYAAADSNNDGQSPIHFTASLATEGRDVTSTSSYDDASNADRAIRGETARGDSFVSSCATLRMRCRDMNDHNSWKFGFQRATGYLTAQQVMKAQKALGGASSIFSGLGTLNPALAATAGAAAPSAAGPTSSFAAVFGGSGTGSMSNRASQLQPFQSATVPPGGISVGGMVSALGVGGLPSLRSVDSGTGTGTDGSRASGAGSAFSSPVEARDVLTTTASGGIGAAVSKGGFPPSSSDVIGTGTGTTPSSALSSPLTSPSADSSGLGSSDAQRDSFPLGPPLPAASSSSGLRGLFSSGNASVINGGVRSSAPMTFSSGFPPSSSSSSSGFSGYSSSMPSGPGFMMAMQQQARRRAPAGPSSSEPPASDSIVSPDSATAGARRRFGMDTGKTAVDSSAVGGIGALLSRGSASDSQSTSTAKPTVSPLHRPVALSSVQEEADGVGGVGGGGVNGGDSGLPSPANGQPPQSQQPLRQGSVGLDTNQPLADGIPDSSPPPASVSSASSNSGASAQVSRKRPSPLHKAMPHEHASSSNQQQLPHRHYHAHLRSSRSSSVSSDSRTSAIGELLLDATSSAAAIGVCTSAGGGGGVLFPSSPSKGALATAVGVHGLLSSKSGGTLGSDGSSGASDHDDSDANVDDDEQDGSGHIARSVSGHAAGGGIRRSTSGRHSDKRSRIDSDDGGSSCGGASVVLGGLEGSSSSSVRGRIDSLDGIPFSFGGLDMMELDAGDGAAAGATARRAVTVSGKSGRSARLSSGSVEGSSTSGGADAAGAAASFHGVSHSIGVTASSSAIPIGGRGPANASSSSGSGVGGGLHVGSLGSSGLRVVGGRAAHMSSSFQQQKQQQQGLLRPESTTSSNSSSDSLTSPPQFTGGRPASTASAGGGSSYRAINSIEHLTTTSAAASAVQSSVKFGTGAADSAHISGSASVTSIRPDSSNNIVAAAISKEIITTSSSATSSASVEAAVVSAVDALPAPSKGAWVPSWKRKQMAADAAASALAAGNGAAAAAGTCGVDGIAAAVTSAIASNPLHHQHSTAHSYGSAGSGTTPSHVTSASSGGHHHAHPHPHHQPKKPAAAAGSSARISSTGTAASSGGGGAGHPQWDYPGVNQGAGSGLWGVWERQGARKSMEDACLLLDSLERQAGLCSVEAAADDVISISGGGRSSTQHTAYYAIFDGHGGRFAADFACQRLHSYIARDARFPSLADLPQAVFEAFLRCDGEFLRVHDAAREEANRHANYVPPHHDAPEALCVNGDDQRPPIPAELLSGTTALVAMVRGSTLLTASLGDSRAVLVRVDGSYEQVSIEHSPESERARIEGVGGWVFSESHISYSKVLKGVDFSDPAVAEIMKNRGQRWVEVSRVNSDLAVSRAIGDCDFKGAHRMAAYPWHWGSPGKSDWHGPPRRFTGDLVLAEPDVRTFPLREGSDAFLLLACDGLWEVLKSDEAVTLARFYLMPRDRGGCGLSPKGAARKLAETALKLGTSDNVTVAVVVLPTAPAWLRQHVAGAEEAERAAAGAAVGSGET